jgi:hypothetical protein
MPGARPVHDAIKSKRQAQRRDSLRRAIDAFNRFPDQDAAKKAIEEAGTYHNLSKGTSFGSRLAKSMSVPVSLLDHIREKTGLEDRKARQYIARYLKDTEVQEDIVAFIEQSL